MLVDLIMPTLNGYDVARNIRAQPWGGAVRIIAVSGWFSPEDIDRISDAGFDAHMSKPIDMDKLPGMLQAAH
jgi:CheY-like chemotaxis protein